jgi:nitrite reductase/ring-hydroxylating ferredoxin subunit
MSFRAVGRVDEFPEGSGVEVILGARSIVVYRAGCQWYALKNICPHEGVKLHQARPRGTVAVCRGHGWEFDMKTGACLRGQTGQRVAVYPVKIEAGVVYVDPG